VKSYKNIAGQWMEIGRELLDHIKEKEEGSCGIGFG
jgi:hypothetical protein